jgi:hypothetical protein
MPKPHSVIEIQDLPGPARTALAYALTRKERPPAFAKRASDLYILWICLGLGALMFGVFSGFGEPETAGQSPGEMIVYGLGFAGIAGGILAGRSKKALREELRFPPGIYVVGSRLIDARTRKLGVFHLLEDRPAITHHHVNGAYRNTTVHWHGFVFTMNRQAAASAALDRVRADLELLAQAAEDQDIDKLLVYDPVAVGVALAESEKEKAIKRLDKPADRAKASATPLIVAGLAVAALSPGAWFVRNHFSIESAYDKISTEWEADAWVRNGGDAARGKLKKAEIAIDNAIRMDKADGLREVLMVHADAPASMRKPAEDALAARYETSRKTALELAGTNEQLTWFIDQVYDKLKSGGSAVMRITVARTDNSALQKLDDLVAANPKLKKRIVPVSGYFGGDNEQTRTEGLHGAVQDGMGQFFPSDVITYGDATADSAKIEIFYVIRLQYEPDGTPIFYTHIDKQGKPIPGSLEYPAVEFELGATLDVPGGPAPKQVTFTASPAPTISVHTSGIGDESSELDNAAVYHAMSESAFSDLQGKLVVALGGAAPEPAADDTGPSAFDTDPACLEMKTAMSDFMDCDKVSESDREKVMTQVEALSETATSPAEMCRAAGEVFEKAAKKARCP